MDNKFEMMLFDLDRRIKELENKISEQNNRIREYENLFKKLDMEVGYLSSEENKRKPYGMNVDTTFEYINEFARKKFDT